jgi:hypothetical protein
LLVDLKSSSNCLAYVLKAERMREKDRPCREREGERGS